MPQYLWIASTFGVRSGILPSLLQWGLCVPRRSPQRVPTSAPCPFSKVGDSSLSRERLALVALGPRPWVVWPLGRFPTLEAPMSRRWLLRAVLLLLAVLAVALAVPDVRWPLWGWLRGESFYRGWPTSYYRHLVKRGVTLEPQDTGELAPTTPALALPLEGRPEVAPAYRRLGLTPRPSTVLIDRADADGAAPVLAELLHDGDTNVV